MTTPSQIQDNENLPSNNDDPVPTQPQQESRNSFYQDPYTTTPTVQDNISKGRIVRS